VALPPVQIPVNVDQQTQLAFKQLVAGQQVLAAQASKTVGTAAQQSTSNTAQIAALQTQINALKTSITVIEAEIAALQAQLGVTYLAQVSVTNFSPVYQSSPGYVSLVDTALVATAEGVVGVASPSANPGQSVTVTKNGGTLTVPSAAFTPFAPVFAGAAGSLTQTPPASGFVLVVGYAVSATSLFVSIGEPVFFTAGRLAQTVTVTAAGELAVVDAATALFPLTLMIIPADTTVTIPYYAFGAFLLSQGLTLDGDLVVDGVLAELDS
jgi:hypothetical protein